MKELALFYLIISFSLLESCFVPETGVSAEISKHDEKLALQQNFKLVGGPCEGCEAIFEYGNRHLLNSDTLPDFNNYGSRIKVAGTVYKPGGKIPASDVIIYVYHTNQEGIYPTNESEKGWAKRHGYIRGWMKTNTNGEYSFYTLKPGTYPSHSEPAHIHLTILEPNGKYYWLGSYHFEGDPLLEKKGSAPESRGGGNAVLSLNKEGNLLVGNRDIELGKNIPDYE
jgi:protocatechuate 3,4-dioxygenase beta subunit